MNSIKRYDLHKDDYSKLHFEINDANSYFENNKAHASVPHRHSFYQIILFKQAGRHFVDYETINHQANTIFFINRNQIHYFCLDAPNEGYLFHFNDSFLNREGKDISNRFSLSIFNEIGSCYLELSDQEMQKIGFLTSFIESEMLRKDDYYKDQVYHYFQNILFQIERLRKLKGNLDVEYNPEHKLAVDFKKLVFREMDYFHSIDYYARQLGTSAKTLTKVSKDVLLNTPANMIRDWKIIEAKRMLSNEKSSIKEIAYGLGFDDPTYFTKYFKKETKLTPKQFQKAFL